MYHNIHSTHHISTLFTLYARHQPYYTHFSINYIIHFPSISLCTIYKLYSSYIYTQSTLIYSNTLPFLKSCCWCRWQFLTCSWTMAMLSVSWLILDMQLWLRLTCSECISSVSLTFFSNSRILVYANIWEDNSEEKEYLRVPY